jgi:SnoaL-like domain
MASAWCDYAFYADEKFSHCGVDAFLLMQKEGQWQILKIVDTRRKESCEPVTRNAIDTVMNRWHHAAAVADETVFFGLMTEDCEYVGTDPSEHWKRDELKKWSEKFFQRDSAWDFKPKSRVVHFTQNGQYAWFDELLDTWMGDCRGSGILIKTSDGWKLQQYVLSMAVLNDLTKDYINLLNKRK